MTGVFWVSVAVVKIVKYLGPMIELLNQNGWINYVSKVWRNGSLLGEVRRCYGPMVIRDFLMRCWKERQDLNGIRWEIMWVKTLVAEMKVYGRSYVRWHRSHYIIIRGNEMMRLINLVLIFDVNLNTECKRTVWMVLSVLSCNLILTPVYIHRKIFVARDALTKRNAQVFQAAMATIRI